MAEIYRLVRNVNWLTSLVAENRAVSFICYTDRVLSLEAVNNVISPSKRLSYPKPVASYAVGTAEREHRWLATTFRPDAGTRGMIANPLWMRSRKVTPRANLLRL